MATLVPNSFPTSRPARTRFTKRATLSIIFSTSSQTRVLSARTARRAVTNSAARLSTNPYITTLEARLLACAHNIEPNF